MILELKNYIVVSFEKKYYLLETIVKKKRYSCCIKYIDGNKLFHHTVTSSVHLSLLIVLNSIYFHPVAYSGIMFSGPGFDECKYFRVNWMKKQYLIIIYLKDKRKLCVHYNHRENDLNNLILKRNILYKHSVCKKNNFLFF